MEDYDNGNDDYDNQEAAEEDEDKELASSSLLAGKLDYFAYQL